MGTSAIGEINILKPYKAYGRNQNSDHWQSLRKVVLHRASGDCESCHKPSVKLATHHTSYGLKGDWSDLGVQHVIALCPACHCHAHRNPRVAERVRQLAVILHHCRSQHSSINAA